MSNPRQPGDTHARTGLALLYLLLGSPVEAQQTTSPQPAALGQAPTVVRQAQQRRAVTALRMGDDERVVLDGRLDEAVWARAVPAADFIQQDPDNGKPATEPTEVRILYNRNALYMGVTCFDSEPDKWLGYQRRRDEFLQADDRFMWTIDTFNNQQTGYYFEMNPSGLMGDALRGAGFQNRQWDGIWNARVLRSEIGWTLEIEIPFRTLNFDPNAESWGINFQRTVRRKNEESLWMGWLRNQGLNRLSNTGELTGLREISEGHGLDIKPYLVGTSESFPGRGDTTVHYDANVGVDFFYSPAPALRTNLTINTDFAQTEVDQRLVNLTRFPLFFPEKRDFFLDGSTFFDFQSNNNGGNSLLPFFSRRIGLDTIGNPQKIDVGGKVAGRLGSHDLGALYVRTGEEDNALGGNKVLGEDFLVLRAKRRMFRQSYVGALYTGRNARDTSTRSLHTVGADFLLATSTFRGSDNLSLGGFFVKTTNPLDTGRNSAFGLVLDYPNDPWTGNVSVQGDPGQLLCRRRLHAPHRLPPCGNRASVHRPSESASLDSHRPDRSRRRRSDRHRFERSAQSRPGFHGDQPWHALAGFLPGARPADLRATRPRLRHQSGHPAASRQRVQTGTVTGFRWQPPSVASLQ